MADSDSTSTSDRKLHCPHTTLSLSLPFLREGSNVLERKPPLTGEPLSPLPTKRTRTYSASVRAKSGPVFKGICKNFSRSQGHGFIRPSHGGEDIFVHISDVKNLKLSPMSKHSRSINVLCMASHFILKHSQRYSS
uniref:Cold shock domain containing C2, RNA binding a n=1 Tax=Cyprinus carpio TaxID=7962 RepID=A0A8C2KNQ7_CYPCA